MPKTGRYCPYCSLDTAPGMGAAPQAQRQYQQPYSAAPPPGYIQRENYNTAPAIWGAVFVPGLGQMINGQIGKGVTLLTLAIVLAPTTSFAGSVALWILAIIDTSTISARIRSGQAVGPWQWF